MRVYLDLCCHALESSYNTVKPRREAVADPGSGNYTEERATLLPDLSLEDLTAEVERIQDAKGVRTEPG